MADDEIEVTFFDQVLFHAGEQQAGVVVAEVGNQHADGEGLALTQRAGVKAGPVLELGGGCRDPVTRILRDGADSGRIVQHQRDGGGRKVQIFTQSA